LRAARAARRAALRSRPARSAQPQVTGATAMFTGPLPDCEARFTLGWRARGQEWDAPLSAVLRAVWLCGNI